MKWQPLSQNEQSLTCELADDPRYQIRAEWVHGRDNINRRQYRAFFNNCVVGEIQSGSNRDAVIAELETYIIDGGVSVMRDIPDVIDQEAGV